MGRSGRGRLAGRGLGLGSDAMTSSASLPARSSTTIGDVAPRAMQQPAHGSVRTPDARRDVVPLVSAYLEFAAGNLPRSERVAIAIAASGACTPSLLRTLAETVRDPFAWVPFFRCLAEIPVAARTDQSRAAFDRLYALGTALLAEHGLSILRPEDLVLVDGPLERAVSELSAT